MRALRGHVSGLCVPEYVLDIPGGHGKSPIGPRYLGDLPEGTRDGAVAVEDWQERHHVYRDASAKPHSTD